MKIKIDKRDSFEKSASTILNFRFKTLRKRIKNYFENPTVESLHKMRISVRRFRYSMENFRVCFRKKDYAYAIKVLKNLQDIIGEGRDLDVLKLNLNEFSRECNIEMPQAFFAIIYTKKEEIDEKVCLELQNFVADSEIKRIFAKHK